MLAQASMGAPVPRLGLGEGLTPKGYKTPQKGA